MLGQRQSQKGMTLVELMIALVLGMVVTGAVIEIFISSKKMYRIQDARARLQENGRFAIQHLVSNIRNSGYRGCARRNSIVNTLNDSNTHLWDFTSGMQGFDASGAVWSPTLDASIVSPVQGTDVLTVRSMLDPVIAVTAHPGGTPPGSANIQVNAPNNLQQFDVLMVTDCEDTAIFQVTSAAPGTSGSLVHNTGVGTDPGNATQALDSNFTGGEIIRLRTSSFYVADPDNDGESSLYQRIFEETPTELVEGVENMQISYGIDTDNDEAADQYVNAGAGINWNRVVSARINLLLRTLDKNIVTEAQTYSFNGAAPVQASDTRIRAAFSRTISLRNRVP
jgi:type IV pilus assembly protein PilW